MYYPYTWLLKSDLNFSSSYTHHHLAAIVFNNFSIGVSMILEPSHDHFTSVALNIFNLGASNVTY